MKKIKNKNIMDEKRAMELHSIAEEFIALIGTKKLTVYETLRVLKAVKLKILAISPAGYRWHVCKNESPSLQNS